MSNPVPSSLALTTPADGATLIASRDRNNDSAIQTAVNAIIAALSGGVAGQVLQAASGSAVQWAGGYTAYTPAWTSTGVAPAIGNGTITGSYLQLGKLTVGSVLLTAGSTTTFGTGGFRLSLPVASAGSGSFPVGAAVAVDVSANQSYPAMAQLVSSTTVNIASLASPQAESTATAPFTFAVGDSIIVNFSYQAS